MNQQSITGGENRIRVHFHITEFNDGGIESSLLQWLRILDRNLFQISLSVTYPSVALESRFRPLIPSDVPVEILADRPWLHCFQLLRHQNRLNKLGRVARDIHTALAVRPHMARRLRTIATNVDVIVDFDLSLRRVCGRFDVAWLGVNHFSFHARLGRRKRRIRRMMNQYRGYDCLAALTEDMADEAKQLFGQQLTRIAVLPNAVDIGWIKKRAAIDAGRPLPGDVPYIVHVARLDEVQKDHATLLRAYAEMLRRHAADEHLVIVGDGAYREALVTLARELGIAGRVHFVGQLDNPHPAMAGASMLVLSSKYEGMPMVLVEALALGKAIVATDCPTGPRAILDHGEAGMLVPVGDVSALAEAMARVLQDETLRRTLSTHAAMRAQYYDVGQSNRRLVESLEEIGCGRGRPAALF